MEDKRFSTLNILTAIVLAVAATGLLAYLFMPLEGERARKVDFTRTVVVPESNPGDVGGVLFPIGDENADDLLSHADAALYQAKEAGRNTFRFFNPSMQQAAEKRLMMQIDLRRSLDGQEELRLFFQPKIDATGSFAGAEALLRWQHPERGIIPPMDFIPIAEESGQIHTIGAWVLRDACKRIRDWNREIPTALPWRIAVNVSSRQFRQADFSTQVEWILAETGADPNHLTLELTESMLMENLAECANKMKLLKQLGVRLSIDDFGTGYSSLAYLKSLPLDEIKIDRAFIQDIASSPADANLVKTIIIMVKQLGLEVVAEGIETAEQHDFLREQNCNFYQGYFFSHPLPQDDFVRYFQEIM